MTDSVAIQRTPLYSREFDSSHILNQAQFRTGVNTFDAWVGIPPGVTTAPLDYRGARLFRLRDLWTSVGYYAGSNPPQNMNLDIEFRVLTNTGTDVNPIWTYKPRILQKFTFIIDDPPQTPLKVFDKTPWYRLEPNEVLAVRLWMRKYAAAENIATILSYSMDVQYIR